MKRDIPRHLTVDLQDTGGLTQEEAGSRLAKFGPNNVLGDSTHSWTDVARDTAKDPMLWFLVGTAALFLWVGDLIEAIIMALAVVPILGMDAYLHRRTLASTEGLAGQLASTVTVNRDGRQSRIAASDIVPGDVVVVATGESFPVDGRIVAGAELQTDESAVTGESMPVRKSPIAVKKPDNTDQHWVFAGTRLLTSEARVQAVYTGAQTIYGEIVRSSHELSGEATVLQQAVNRLLYYVTAAALLMCVALVGIRYLQGHGIADALVSGVTLAVAALPEEFPVALTFIIGMGVFRLARQKALVRRAVAVENIGRVTCICTDKTGTITEGKLFASDWKPAPHISEKELRRVIAAAVRPESSDPLDRVILTESSPPFESRAAVFPFTEDRRRETVVYQSARDRYVACVKGAPETVLAMCALPAMQRRYALEEALKLAEQGRKVIAVAQSVLRKPPKKEPKSQFRYVGLVAFQDPVRVEVPDAIDWVRRAGMKVILVTGDHAATARSIAIQAGIGAREPIVIEGAGLHEVIKAGALKSIDVVARSTPMQKLDLVQALRLGGDIMLVTGDGVNDVPALNGADVSIAMGERGTRPARESAMIVLLDDSFKTVANAILDGKQLFQNLRRCFSYLLIVHIPLVLAAAVVPLVGYPLLFLPVHIVWLELIIHPTAVLAFQVNAMHNFTTLTANKTPSNRSIFSRNETLLICAIGFTLGAAIVAGYAFALGPSEDVAHARALGLSILITSNSAVTLGLSPILRGPAALIAAVTLMGSVPAIQVLGIAQFLHLSPLHLTDWVLAAAAALAIWAITAATLRH